VPQPICEAQSLGLRQTARQFAMFHWRNAIIMFFPAIEPRGFSTIDRLAHENLAVNLNCQKKVIRITWAQRYRFGAKN
jgi:hypothetical protein